MILDVSDVFSISFGWACGSQVVKVWCAVQIAPSSVKYADIHQVFEVVSRHWGTVFFNEKTPRILRLDIQYSSIICSAPSGRKLQSMDLCLTRLQEHLLDLKEMPSSSSVLLIPCSSRLWFGLPGFAWVKSQQCINPMNAHKKVACTSYNHKLVKHWVRLYTCWTIIVAKSVACHQ